MMLLARVLTLLAFPVMIALPFWFPEPWLIVFVALWLAGAAYGWARF